jgi:hypothetical protein
MPRWRASTTTSPRSSAASRSTAYVRLTTTSTPAGEPRAWRSPRSGGCTRSSMPRSLKRPAGTSSCPTPATASKRRSHARPAARRRPTSCCRRSLQPPSTT